MSVGPIASAAGTSSALPTSPVKAGTGKANDNVFAKLVKGANQQQLAADVQMEKLAAGESDGLHQVILTAAKADLSFRLVLELRNKLMDSYQEIMRMQV